MNVMQQTQRSMEAQRRGQRNFQETENFKSYMEVLRREQRQTQMKTDQLGADLHACTKDALRTATDVEALRRDHRQCQNEACLLRAGVDGNAKEIRGVKLDV